MFARYQSNMTAKGGLCRPGRPTLDQGGQATWINRASVPQYERKESCNPLVTAAAR